MAPKTNDPVASAKTSDGSVDQQAVTGGDLSVASVASTTPNGSSYLNGLGERAYATARSKGFYDTPPTIPERLCLVHSEVSEALEAYRDDDLELRFEASGKPQGLPSELADVVIRIADMCAYLGIDLAEAVESKMAYNATRPHKHGRARL